MLRIIQVPLILLIGWLGGGTWYWVCQVRGYCGDEAAAVEPPPDPAPPSAVPAPGFVVSGADGRPRFRSEAPLRFPADQAQGLVPEGVAVQFDTLAHFLQAHPREQLRITGLYYRNEQADSGQNLGLRRAIFVAQALAQRGAPSDQLTRLPKRLQQALATDTLTGGVELNLLAPLAEGSAEEAERPEAQDFYFGYNQSNLELSDDERAYIAAVIQYVRTQPGAQLQLTGHTDDKGPDRDNYELGLERARTVQGFFQAFGLPSDRVQVASQGERQPIASNATTEGRSQNRRVAIQVISGS